MLLKPAIYNYDKVILLAWCGCYVGWIKKVRRLTYFWTMLNKTNAVYCFTFWKIFIGLSVIMPNPQEVL